MTNLDIVRALEDCFEAEVHRTISFKVYPHDDGSAPVSITVYRGTDGYFIAAESGTPDTPDYRHAASNTHPTFEGALANFAVHARKVGLEIRPRG